MQCFFPKIVGLLFALATSGCGSATYMDFALAPGASDPMLQKLAERAKGGDKQALLQLGIIYEKGIGVDRNKDLALTLYRLAARSKGISWIYVPAVDGSGAGRVQGFAFDPVQKGLPEARARILALEAEKTDD